LVDDDPGVRRALARDLRRDFDVVCVDGAVTGRRILAEGGSFAAVVSDLEMETRTAGAELLEEIQRRFPGCGRVLVSGAVSGDLAARLLASGAVHEFVRKPWNGIDLTEAVRRAVSVWKGV
jgi:DNA-binding NtrC family response regulator